MVIWTVLLERWVVAFILTGFCFLLIIRVLNLILLKREENSIRVFFGCGMDVYIVQLINLST